MKILIAHLQLSDNLSGRTRERCPYVVFTLDGDVISSIRTDVESPSLPLDDGDADALEVRDDALSRVIDEQAWMGELVRVIRPGGQIRLTLPATGALAWLDAMNLYRYATDIGKRGHSPDAALPTGWNRHYSRTDVTSLLRAAGCDSITLQPSTYADKEIGLLGTLMAKNWIGGDRSAEHTAWPRLGQRRFGHRSSILATTWSISAIKNENPGIA